MSKSKLGYFIKNSVNNCPHPPLDRHSSQQPSPHRNLRDYVFSLFITSATMVALMISSGAQAIIKGAPSEKPWVVQVFGLREDLSPSTCSGVAINDLMILTSKHCKVDMVIFSNDERIRDIQVASRHDIPGIDMQVIVLAENHLLAEYPELITDAYSPTGSGLAGTRGTLYGYGDNFYDEQRSLNVQIDMYAAHDHSTEAFFLHLLNGSTDYGDSGGPLIINGMLAGILTGEGYTDAGEFYIVADSVLPAISTIRQSQHAREMRSIAESKAILPWISAVKIEHGAVSVTMSAELINSNRQVMVWVNGKYLGEVQGKNYYYATKQDVSGGATFRMGGNAVRSSDIVQIGFANGVNNPEVAELLYETPVTGIQAVKIENGALAITMSADLINSGHKIAAWVNGKYQGEVQGEKYYYATRQNIPGGAIFRMGGNPVKYGDLVQIGIVTGTNSPSAAVLLYTGRPSGIESVTVHKEYTGISLSNSLINSGQRVVFWVNGAYAGEVFNGTTYYMFITWTSADGKVVSPYVPAPANSLLQIGVVPGVPGDGFGTPDKAKLLVDRTL